MDVRVIPSALGFSLANCVDSGRCVRSGGENQLHLDFHDKEQHNAAVPGGFWVIEAVDLDAALGWARKATVACEGPVEVRPFQHEVDVPQK